MQKISKNEFISNIDPVSEIKAILVPHASPYYSGIASESTYSLLNNKYNFIIEFSTRHSGKKGILVQGNNKLEKDLLYNYSNIFKKDTDEFNKEHSHKFQNDFYSKYCNNCKRNIFLIGELTIGELNNVSGIFDKILYENKESILIMNSDFLHTNGKFSHKTKSEDILQEIKSIDNKYIERILNVNEDTYQYLLNNSNSSDTPCGINVLILWSKMDIAKKVYGKIISYYTSLQVEKNNNNSSVSYLGAVFIEKNTININNIGNLLSKYEQNELIKMSKKIISLITKNKSIYKKYNRNKQNNEAIDYINLKKNIPKYVILKSPFYNFRRGFFVTINFNGNLRGCIGIINPKIKTIYNGTIIYTIASMFLDTRFDIIKYDLNYEIKINILGEKKSISDISDWSIGKNGLIVEANDKSGVYLPNVATDMNWTKKETLFNILKKAKISDGENYYLYEIPGYEFK